MESQNLFQLQSGNNTHNFTNNTKIVQIIKQ